MRLRVGAATHIGRVRVLNEDSHALMAERGLFVVCDGMGGEAAGEVASRLAVSTILDHLKNGSEIAAGVDDQGYQQTTSRLGEAVRRSNQSIYDEAQKDARRSGMGTTVVGAWVTPHIVSLAHVGDSRAYLWHEGQLEPLTTDHSLVEMQVRAGLLDREESLKSKDQNILLRVLGREAEVEVELSEVPVRTGDYLLLCSDGLTRMVPEPEMAKIIRRMREPDVICAELIDVANLNGGVDNVTVIVVEIQGTWWRRLLNRFRRNA